MMGYNNGGGIFKAIALQYHRLTHNSFSIFYQQLFHADSKCFDGPSSLAEETREFSQTLCHNLTKLVHLIHSDLSLHGLLMDRTTIKSPFCPGVPMDSRSQRLSGNLLCLSGKPLIKPTAVTSLLNQVGYNACHECNYKAYNKINDSHYFLKMV